MSLAHDNPDCTGRWLLDWERGLICCMECGILHGYTPDNRRAAERQSQLGGALAALTREGKRLVKRRIQGHHAHRIGQK